MSRYATRILGPRQLAEQGWVDEILQLDRENMAPILAATGLDFPEPQRRDGLSGESTDVALLLAGGTLAGYLEIARDWNDADGIFISSLQIRGRFQGTRALPILIVEGADLLRSRRFDRLTASVQAENAKARRLYTRLGLLVEPPAANGFCRVSGERSLLESEPLKRLERAVQGRYEREEMGE